MENDKTQFGDRIKVNPPTIVQHPPIIRPVIATVQPFDANGRPVVHIPDPTVAPTHSPVCPRCKSPALTIQASGRLFCVPCQQTLGWIEGRIILGADKPPAKTVP